MKDQFAENYGGYQAWHWWFKGRQDILESVLHRHLPPPRAGGRRVLASVGSGPPSGLTWLAPFAGEDGVVVGLDADPSGGLRAHVRAAGDRGTDNVRLVYSHLERPALRPGSCDAVLALDVLEHLDDDVGGLAAAADLVGPGGLLLVTVPALPSLWGRQDIVSQHRRRYTRKTLVSLFERAGLPRPRTTFFNSMLFLPIAAVRYARRLVPGPADSDASDFDGARPGLVNDQLRRLFSSERHLLARMNLPIGVSLMAIHRAPLVV
jgi:SAM-dependent methyltransferase